MNYDDINKFGVGLQYVEYKIAHIEQRVNERLTEYFTNKMAGTVNADIDNVHVRDMTYRKIGGNQELLCCVKFKDYSLFYNITYSPYENNKTGSVGLKFNSCEKLDLIHNREEIKERYKNLNRFKRCDIE